MVDHIGGLLGIGPYAGKREEVFQQWKSGIAELSTCPNVVAKLGGLGLPVCGFGWSERTTPPNSIELAEAMAPYYHWCIEQFGVDRCMFESNFPVDKVSYSYNVCYHTEGWHSLLFAVKRSTFKAIIIGEMLTLTAT
jgi:predicted TIM-barrel fold metal-dependent hydrolase